MEEIIEKLYNSYFDLLNELEIGYPISNEKMNNIWEMIQLIDFMVYGCPSESELLQIADTYENIFSL